MSRWLKEVLAPIRRFDSGNVAAAVERYRDDHAEDFGRPGSGTCPVCGHHDCFGRNGLDSPLWYCFSANHAVATGADGRPVGRKGSKGYFGDVLDLHSHRDGRSRIEHLAALGYLTATRANRPKGKKSADHEDHDDWRELYEERLSVRIHDGELPEPLARILARQDVEELLGGHRGA